MLFCGFPFVCLPSSSTAEGYLANNMEDIEMIPLLLLTLMAVSVLACILLVRNKAAYRQTAQDVVIREPEHRLLGPPQPLALEALKHLQFAWLSQTAYQRSPTKEKFQRLDSPTDLPPISNPVMTR